MDPSLDRYAQNLRTRRAAESYSTKYERIWHKRISDRRERAVIARALALTGGPHPRVLDMPCGAGRLTGELLAHAEAITLCDFSEEQIAIARRRAEDAGLEPGIARANALSLPFADGAFDLVFSVRLSHHIGDAEDRRRYIRELLRVSRGFVVVTIFDEASIKSRLREMRRRLGSAKRSKYTMGQGELAAIAEAAGFTIKAALPISRLMSGHRYMVFARQA